MFDNLRTNFKMWFPESQNMVARKDINFRWCLWNSVHKSHQIRFSDKVSFVATYGVYPSIGVLMSAAVRLFGTKPGQVPRVRFGAPEVDLVISCIARPLSGLRHFILWTP